LWCVWRRWLSCDAAGAMRRMPHNRAVGHLCVKGRAVGGPDDDDGGRGWGARRSQRKGFGCVGGVCAFKQESCPWEAGNRLVGLGNRTHVRHTGSKEGGGGRKTAAHTHARAPRMRTSNRSSQRSIDRSTTRRNGHAFCVGFVFWGLRSIDRSIDRFAYSIEFGRLKEPSIPAAVSHLLRNRKLLKAAARGGGSKKSVCEHVAQGGSGASETSTVFFPFFQKSVPPLGH
jgi:hypothetical protein